MKGRSLFVLVVWCVLSALALAQVENGEIAGTVTDPSGAVVAGAQVTAKSLERQNTRTTTTTARGEYSLTALPPGKWEVSVEAPRFAPIKKVVTVTVGSKNPADFKLSVAGATTEIEVVGGGTQVETESPEVGQVVTEKEITQLPTLTRNPYDLVATAGNVQEDTKTTNSRGAGFAINGQRSASTGITLDGSENVDMFTASVGQTVPLDSVQEFRVISNDFGAQYGRAGGGVINVVTKSGTNNLHGTAYEFNRTSATTANTYDNNANAVPKGKYTRNQFGYSAGGPIIKSKLFFFNSTEWLRVRSNAEVLAQIPDAAFIAQAAPATQQFFSAFGTLRPGLRTVGTLSQAQVASVLCSATSPCPLFSALPASMPAFDTVSYAVPADAGGGSPQNSINSVVRIDYNLSEKTSIFGRYGINKVNFFQGTVVNSPYAGFDSGENDLNQNALLSVTHIFSPNVVNQSKFTFNRLNQLQPLGPNPVGPTLYMTGSTVTLAGQLIALPGYSQFTPGNAIPFGGPQNVGELNDDLIWTKGKHQLRFGGQYLYTKDNRAFGAYEEAVETLGTNKSVALDNFLRGQLRQFQAAVDPQGKFPCPVDVTGTPMVSAACTLQLPVGAPSFSRSNRYHDGAAYGMDNWRITPRLTLNLGVRWEYYGVQHNGNPNLDSNFYFGAGDTLVQKLQNGQVLTVPNSPIGSLWEPQKHNFAPRVGFAWDVFGNGRTSLRGGYGIAYERNFGNVTFNVIQNPPNYAVISLVAGTDVPSIGVTTENSGPLAGTSGTKPLPLTSLRYVRQDMKTAYTEFWNLGVQRELGRRTMLSLDYTGAHGVHQYSIANFNKPGFGVLYGGTDPAVNPTDRLNRQYSNINTRGSDGFNYYNGLNVRVSSSNLLNLGLALNANYTWSHSIDNLSSTFSEGTQDANLGQLDPFRPAVDKGSADYDARHRFVLSAVWDLPLGKSSHGLWKQVVNGWSLAPIFNVHSGYPFTIFDCSNEVDTTSCARLALNAPMAITGGTGGTDQGGNTFNYLAYPVSSVGIYADPLTGAGELPACPAPGSAPGQCNFPSNMTRRNAFRMPGVWHFDAGIYKNFKLSERFGLQFRSEMFDALNHSNFYVLTGGSADVSALNGFIQGKKGTDADPGAFILERRFVQFALKLSF